MGLKGIYPHSASILDTIREQSDTALLFYSGGKDSIVLLDMLAKRFKRVECIFMYFVKDLAHINRFLDFSAKRYNNVTIHQIPHWILTKIHSSGFFCAPRKVRQLTLSDVIKATKLRLGQEWAFLGMKQADNMARRIMLRGYENQGISTTKNAYPLSLWKDRDVLKYIERHRLPQPINYGGKKRSSGVCFDVEVFLWLREHYPSDLAKILAQYPLSEKILFEHDYAQAQEKTNGK